MILAVIPARWASTRFPGKPLAEINGKTMIERVYAQVKQSQMINHVIVATDDERIYQHVRDFGGDAQMTRPDHPSGTDRCAEIAEENQDFDFIVNVQGDEPFIQPEQIDLLCKIMTDKIQFPITTLAKRITRQDVLNNPNVVKVAFSHISGALYFSRNPIPYLRDVPPEKWLKKHHYYKHIGIYGFDTDTLLQVSRLSPTPLEKAEKLEQLRWLEYGFRIGVGITEWETAGIDTPEDLLTLSV